MAPQVTPERTTRDVQARTASVPAHAIRRRGINVGGAERLLSVAAGTLLGLWASGRRRRGSGRLGLATASGLLLERGLTGTCRLYRAMGINTVTGMPRDGWRPVESARRDLIEEARRTVDRAVTILRPRLEVGTALRDVASWPSFADIVESAEVSDARHARLRLRGADGRSLACELELDEDLPDAALAWRVFNQAGHVIARLAIGLADAPGGRGTEVRLSAVAEGEVPDAVTTFVAKLAGEAPEQQVRRVLRRFKQLMETGEVVSAAGPSGRRGPDRFLGRALRTRTDASPRLPRKVSADVTASPTGGM
ncbi:MAG: YgaP-like transmembrane domain [Polyangia bacterium]